MRWQRGASPSLSLTGQPEIITEMLLERTAGDKVQRQAIKGNAMRNKYFFLILVAFLLGGCAARVDIDYDRQADFARLKTFKLAECLRDKTGDPRIDSPLVEKRIRASIVKYLKSRGFAEDDTAADFVVQYRIGIRKEIESDSSGIVIGFGSSRSHSAFGLSYAIPFDQVGSYDKAVLTIDVLDGETGELLWRGSYGKRLYDGLTPEKLDATIDSTVREILTRFPPGQAR